MHCLRLIFIALMMPLWTIIPANAVQTTEQQLTLLQTISTAYDVPVDQGINLSVHYTASKAPTRTVVVYLPGRASYFEKNMGLILGMTGHSAQGTNSATPSKPVDFWCIDMRGHGTSGGRLGPNDQRGHIDSFDTYVADIHKVLTTLIAPTYQGQNVNLILMGSSLGGHLALRYIQDHTQDMPLPFKRVLLVAPMIDFNTKPWPVSVAKALACSACALGFNTSYVVGYGPVNLDHPNFAKFKDHHSPEAFAETNLIMQKTLSSVTGGPTYGWVKAAFESEKKLHTKPLPTGLDIIAFIPEKDTTVSPEITEVFAKNHGITTILYPKSAHNVFKEPLAYAPTFWQDLFKSTNFGH